MIKPPRKRTSVGASVLAATALLASACSSSAHAPVAAPAKAAAVRAVATPAAAASPDCRAQVQAWLGGGASGQLNALESDFGSFGLVAKMFAGAADGAGASFSDIDTVQSAAATIQADAQTMAADPGPACAPGVRHLLAEGVADYEKAAADADDGMGKYEGAVQPALLDMRNALDESGLGNEEITGASLLAQDSAGS